MITNIIDHDNKAKVNKNLLCESELNSLALGTRNGGLEKSFVGAPTLTSLLNQTYGYFI